MGDESMVPLHYDEVTLEIARRILATNPEVVVVRPVLTKAGVSRGADLSGFRLDDALQQKGVGHKVLMDEMIAAAGDANVSVSDLTHPMATIPPMPHDRLNQALHAGLILVETEKRRWTFREPVYDDKGAVVGFTSTPRSDAYNSRHDRKDLQHVYRSNPTSGWGARSYRLIEGDVEAITLTEDKRSETARSICPIEWPMPRIAPSGIPELVNEWGCPRHEALVHATDVSYVGGENRDVLHVRGFVRPIEDEYEAYRKDRYIHHLDQLANQLVGTDLEKARSTSIDPPALTRIPKSDPHRWSIGGERTSRNLQYSKADIMDLVDRDWIVRRDQGGYVASTRLRRAKMSAMISVGSYGQLDSIMGYEVPGYEPVTDGRYLVLWFDGQGCVRIDSAEFMTFELARALEAEIAAEAGVKAATLRIDFAYAHGGFLRPAFPRRHDAWEENKHRFPVAWGKIRDQNVSRERMLLIDTLLEGFDEALSECGVAEHPGPLPGRDPDVGAPEPEDKRPRLLVPESSPLAAPATDGPDHVVRSRALVTILRDNLRSRGTYPTIHVAGRHLRVQRVIDVDYEAGLMTIKAIEDFRAGPYSSGTRTVGYNALVDISSIASMISGSKG